MSIDIAVEKSDGTLKRLAGTPLSLVSYFIGKIGQVLVTGAPAGGAAHRGRARRLRGRAADRAGRRGSTFAWVFLLGVTTCAILGIGLSGLPRSGKSATAVIIPIVLVLQFISGVYIQFSMLPDWLQNVASLFPLKWLAQGMRVGVPARTATRRSRRAASWNLAGVAHRLRDLAGRRADRRPPHVPLDPQG